MILRFPVNSPRVIIWFAVARGWVHQVCRGPFRSPYFASQVVLARQCTNIITMLWSIIALHGLETAAISQTPYLWITEYVPASVIGAVLGSIALGQFLWIWPLERPPLKHAAWGYALLAFCWGFVCFSYYFTSSILFPTAGSILPVVFGLALYGFIAIPTVKVKRDGLV